LELSNCQYQTPPRTKWLDCWRISPLYLMSLQQYVW